MKNFVVAPNSPGKEGKGQKKNAGKKQKIGGGISPPPKSQVDDVVKSHSKGKGGILEKGTEGEGVKEREVKEGSKSKKKGEDKGSLIIWNKGNSRFQAKKADIEVILEKYKPLVMGILEANMGINICTHMLGIDGYILERDNLIEQGCRTRTAIYINEKLEYKRRKDLEVKGSPAIWIEISPDSTKSWLLFVGYREWRSLLDKDKEKSLKMEQQLIRLEKWNESWKKADKEGKPMYIMGDLNIDVIP